MLFAFLLHILIFLNVVRLSGSFNRHWVVPTLHDYRRDGAFVVENGAILCRRTLNPWSVGLLGSLRYRAA